MELVHRLWSWLGAMLLPAIFKRKWDCISNFSAPDQLFAISPAMPRQTVSEGSPLAFIGEV